MKPFLASAFISIVSLLLSVACFSSSGSPNKRINIGIYAPFSNESAFIGRNMLGALEIARDQLRSGDIKYSFYTLDDASGQANPAITLQKFIETYHIQVLLTASADAAIVAAPIAKKNKLIHFSLSSEQQFADGENNFLAQGPEHRQRTGLTSESNPEFIAQFEKEYFSQPVVEAGYTYDIFQLIHRSALLAMNQGPVVSSQDIVVQLLAFGSGKGVVGDFDLSKKGLAYKSNPMVA